MDNLVFWRGRPQEALEVGRRAEETISDPALRDEVAGRRAFLLLTEGRIVELRAMVEPLIARATGNRLAYATVPATFVYGLCGEVERALEVADRGRAAIDEQQPLMLPASFNRWAASRVLVYCGRLREGHAVAVEEHEAAVAAGSSLAQGVWALALAEVRFAQGHARDAAAWGLEAVTVLRRAGGPTFVRRAYPSYVQALALSADRADVRRALDEIERTGAAWVSAGQVEWLIARAWVSVAAGDIAAGRRLLAEAAALAREQTAAAREAIALHDLARLGGAVRVAERLRTVAGQAEGPFAPACSAHAQALVAADPDGLLAACDQFEAIGALLLAAECAADASVVLARSLEHRLATAAQRRAQTLAEACGNPRTPALSSLDARVELTATEREIAVLAAAGCANRQIAAERVISLRTVENTLRRVYMKLGITGREQLPDALGQR
jgi:DNA-binding CsgD family transcriptional regulator